MANERENLEVVLTTQVEKAEEELDSFRQRFHNTPAVAFEWADDAVLASVRLEVYKLVQRDLEKFPGDEVRTVGTIIEHARRYVKSWLNATNLRGATTSPANRMTMQARAVVAWAWYDPEGYEPVVKALEEYARVEDLAS